MNWLEILGWTTLGMVIGFGLCALWAAYAMHPFTKGGE